MKKIHLFLCLLVGVMVAFSCSFLMGCGEEVKNEKKKYLMRDSRLTLEKHESSRLTVLSDALDFKWSSTDETVAKVDNNGTVTAIGAGSSVIKAVHDSGEAKCLITVTDNAMLPRINVNIDEEQLYLVRGENFRLEHYISYNGKTVDAKTDVVIEGEQGVLTYNDSESEIVAVANGNVKLIIIAEWAGMQTRKVINVGVISNIVAKIFDESSATIYNDSRGGRTFIELSPSIYENGERLNEGDYVPEDLNYDKNVVSFDEKTNRVSFLTKGETFFEMRYKSKLTGDSVSSGILIKTELYNEDKTSEITLRDVYVSDGFYDIAVADVFKDVSELDNCTIKEVRDVLNGNLLLDYNDGKINTSNFISTGVMGERKWLVECEKYAYTVTVNVEERNYAAPLYGTYDFESKYYTIEKWNYTLDFESLNGTKAFKFVNKETNELGCKGYFELAPWQKERDGGAIKLVVTDNYLPKVFTQKIMDGYFWLNNGGVLVNLYIYSSFGTGYNLPVNYYSVDSAPYKALAGEYKTNKWETCVFILDDKKGALLTVNGTNYPGNYVLRPDSAYDGKIIISLEKEFRNQAEFVGNYVLSDGVYGIHNVKFDFNDKTFNYGQNADKKPFIDDFAGFYWADAQWQIRFMLNKDGTVIFHETANYKDNMQKDGVYELIPNDAVSGTIKFTFYKPYCLVYTYEGVYNIVDGKYVFKIDIPGSGTDTLRTFTRKYGR